MLSICLCLYVYSSQFWSAHSLLLAHSSSYIRSISFLASHVLSIWVLGAFAPASRYNLFFHMTTHTFNYLLSVFFTSPEDMECIFFFFLLLISQNLAWYNKDDVIMNIVHYLNNILNIYFIATVIQKGNKNQNILLWHNNNVLYICQACHCHL